MGEFLFEGGPVFGFDFQKLLFAGEVGFVVAAVAVELGEVDFDDAGGEALEEGAVVCDEEEGELAADEEVFEPEDGVDIEVVGRLVEDEDAGFADEGFSEEGAAFESSGEGGEAGVGVELEVFEGLLDAGFHLPLAFWIEVVVGKVCVESCEGFAFGAESGGDDFADGGVEILWNLLGQGGGDAAFREGDGAGVGAVFTGDDFEEGGFAGSVSSEHADAFAAVYVQAGVFQYGGSAEADGQFCDAENGHVLFLVSRLGV